MTLALSQSLFSSADVDRGTRLLLKAVSAHRADLPDHPIALDMGCGCGVLGIALSLDGARVLFRDRDALAVAFSEYNCRANGVDPLGFQCGLDLRGTGYAGFDLIVSNLPAKAGQSVHAAMMRAARRHLAPWGVVSLVVVSPLRDRIAAAAVEAGLHAEVVELTQGHAVFRATDAHKTSAASAEDTDTLYPYHRTEGRFRCAGRTYTLRAMHDVAEFDNLAHGTALALEALADPGIQPALGGRILVWNPGQGHVPAWLRAGAHQASARVTVAGRDALALLASEANGAGVVKERVHTWRIGDAGRGYGCAVLFPETDGPPGWEARLALDTMALLADDGLAVFAAGSTSVARYLKTWPATAPIWSRKTAGSRCVVVRRAPPR